MTAALSFLALLVAVGALADAAWRSAAALGADGGLRVVAAAPLAAAAAAATVLVLGRVGLSGSQPLLVATALALMVLARVRLPDPRAAFGLPFTRRERLALGAAAGLAVAWTTWVVRYPGLGLDALTYHLSTSVAWVQQGDAGAVRQATYVFPVGNYPLLDELLVSWLLAVGRSFAVANLWAPAMTVLTVVAGVTGLRRAGVGLLPAALGCAAVLSTPVWARLWIGPHTDPGALAWLACAAALAVAARQRPGLLAPAIIAAGLAIGTKTTTVVVLAALVVFVVRPPLPRRSVLVVATGVAAVLGGLWYVRNLIQHGSPLWPFLATPWGDPVPAIFRVIDETFAGTLRTSLEGDRPEAYVRALGLAPILLIAAPLAAAAVRTRRVLLTAGVAAVATLAWTRAPFTGRSPNPLVDFSLGTTRYLVPALATTTVALCLAWADGGPRVRRAISGVLGTVTVVSLLYALDLGYPNIPALRTLVFGALVGMAAAYFTPRYAPAVGALMLAVIVVAGSDGFAERHARNPDIASSPFIGWLEAQPAFTASEANVYAAPQIFSVLAGDRLQRELSLIDLDTSCATIRNLRGWLVLGTVPRTAFLASVPAIACMNGIEPVYADDRYRVYDRRQTATRSSAASRPSSTSEKSSASIAAAARSGSRRARLSSVS